MTRVYTKFVNCDSVRWKIRLFIPRHIVTNCVVHNHKCYNYTWILMGNLLSQVECSSLIGNLLQLATGFIVFQVNVRRLTLHLLVTQDPEGISTALLRFLVVDEKTFAIRSIVEACVFIIEQKFALTEIKMERQLLLLSGK